MPTPPSLQTLLPPILAHLPLGYTSSQIPPSLLPLLSPILRSRLQLLSSTTESWLTLLVWSPSSSSSSAGQELLEHVKNQDFTPHPSGEIDTSDAELLGIRRVDRELLESRVALRERGLLLRFAWVEGEKEVEDGWKVLSISLCDDSAEKEDGERWFKSVWEAEEEFTIRTSADSQKVSAPAEEEEDDDDAYWSRYDNEDSESAPASPTKEGPSEDDYFARYGEGEAEMEHHEPEPEPYQFPSYTHDQNQNQPPRGFFSPFPTTHNQFLSDNLALLEKKVDTLSPPETEPSETDSRPVSMFVKGTSPVKKAERERNIEVQVEAGIRTHIATSIKSLFRLARAGGMEREEFERLVQTELGVLEMMEED